MLLIRSGCDTSASNVPRQRFKYFPVDQNKLAHLQAECAALETETCGAVVVFKMVL